MWDPVGSRNRRQKPVGWSRIRPCDWKFYASLGEKGPEKARPRCRDMSSFARWKDMERTSGGFWPQIADQLAVLDYILSGFLFSTVSTSFSSRQGTRIRHQCLSVDVLCSSLDCHGLFQLFPRDKSTTFNPYKTSAPWRLMCHICCSHL